MMGLVDGDRGGIEVHIAERGVHAHMTHPLRYLGKVVSGAGQSSHESVTGQVRMPGPPDLGQPCRNQVNHPGDAALESQRREELRAGALNCKPPA